MDEDCAIGGDIDPDKWEAFMRKIEKDRENAPQTIQMKMELLTLRIMPMQRITVNRNLMKKSSHSSAKNAPMKLRYPK